MTTKDLPSPILVTGANGFVGKALCRRLVAEGCQVIGAVRKPTACLPPGVRQAVVGNIEEFDSWGPWLDQATAVCHLAGRVHIMKDTSDDPLAEFRKVNVKGTRLLLRACADKNISRFLFMSTVKVHGEGRETAYCETDAIAPQDAYAISKAEAEQEVHSAGRQGGGLETVIIRPPLVYGPGVKANFLKLIRLADCGIPLPLASVDNRRSLVFLENLVDFLICCLTHSDAASQSFVVSDGVDLSTGGLYQKIGDALGRKARLFNVPPPLLRQLGRLTGKSDAIDRLCGSLAVDISKSRARLGWQPPETVEDGIRQTIDWYSQHGKR